MGAGVSVMGKIEAGIAQTGEKILVMPAGEQGIIKGVQECYLSSNNLCRSFGIFHIFIYVWYFLSFLTFFLCSYRFYSRQIMLTINFNSLLSIG